MATLIDLEGEFYYKPQYTPPSYDPGVPENTPTPAAQPAQSQNRWNSDFQAWEDPNSGALWDADNNVWWSRDGQVYRDNVGWQSTAQYNDYNKVLQEMYGGQDGGGFAGNPVVAQPSAFQPSQTTIPRANFVNYDLQQDNYRNDPPRAAFNSYDLATSRDVPFPATERYNPSFEQLNPSTAGRGRTAGIAPTGGNALSALYGAYNRNIAQPIAETGAQLTPLLNVAGAPASHLTGGIASRFGVGNNPNQSLEAGVRELGTALQQSGGNPLKFRDLQNENLAERPGWQQKAATTAYDPTNLIGAGIGAHALKGGIEGTSLLSKIARAAATADRAIDVGQAKVVGGLLSPVVKGLEPILPKVKGLHASEVGSFSFGRQAGDDIVDPAVREILGLPPLGQEALPTPTSRLARGLGAEPIMNPSASSNADIADRFYLVSNSLDRIESKQERLARQIMDATDDGLDTTALRAQQESLNSMVDNYMQEQDILQREIWDREARGEWQNGQEWLGYQDRKNALSLEDFKAKRAGESGSISANLAARGALATGAAAAGYATADDDATAQEKLLRALGFGAGAALGPEVIGKLADTGAKGYSSVLNKIGAPERGVGHAVWLEDAPISDVLAGKDIDPVLYLKDVTTQKLPVRTRISNAFWNTLAKADRDRFITNVDDARVRNIAVMDKTNREAIPNVADLATNEYAPELSMFPVDENGAVLIDGARLPALGKDGLPVIQKDGSPVMGAGFADLHEKKEWYLENGFISQEQYDALNRIQAALQPYHDLQAAFGLAPDPDLRIDPTAGAYFPRGKPVSQLADTTPARDIPGSKAGTEPGSSKARDYATQAEGIADGKRYPAPVETFKKYISEVLAQTNAENTSRNLEKVAFEMELKTGKQTITLGDLRVDPALRDNLKEQIVATRGLRKDLRELKARQTRIDRDVRLGTRWVNQQRNRIETLGKTIAETTDGTAKAQIARDTLEVTKQALKDAESAAREYASATAKSAIKDSDARRVLNEILTDAKRVSDEMNRLEDQIAAGEFADLQQKVSGAWNYADGIRAAVAQDVLALERVMADLAGQYGDALPARIASQEALSKVKGQFSEAITGFRQLAKEGQVLAAREATAAANVRSALKAGRTQELDRLIDRRAASLKSAVANSQELGVEIDRLKQMLAPTRANVKQIQQDIANVRNIARQVQEKYPKGKIAGIGWGLKGWENVPMPTEIANAFRKYELQKGTTGVAGNLYDLVNGAFRMMGATLDASRTATVGMLNLADKPGTSLKGLKTGVETAFKDPGAAARVLREIETEGVAETGVKLTTAVARGLQMSSSEQLLKGLADEGTWVDSLAKKPGLKQAETLYSVPANVERASRFYDTLRAWKAAGKDYTSDKALAMAANTANTLTGRSSQGLGEIIIGSKGASRLFFAPRFIQSQFESLANAMMVGGVEGEEARRAMLKLVMGGAAMTYAINELNHEKTDWNILQDGRINPNFMRVRLGDQDISLFGPWDSLAKGMIATAMGDKDYFLRSKLGPVPGIVADTVNGMNAIGEKIPKPWEKDYYTPENLARIAPVPFGARNIAETAMETDFSDPKSVGNLALATGASVLGIKSSPLSAREQYIRTLSDVYPEYKPTVDYPKPSNPDDDPLFMAEFAATNPSKVPKPSSELGKELKKIRDPMLENQKKNTDKFVAGEKTLGEWKADRKVLKQAERDSIAHIVEQFGDQKPPEGTPAYWVQEYFKTFKEATVDGLLDYDKLDALQGELLAKAPPWVSDYMDSYFLATSDPGPEREYRAAINQLNKDGYFSGDANSMPRYQGMLSGLSDKQIDDYRKIIDDWSARPEYAFLKGKNTETKATVILGDFWDKTGQEYDPIVVKDVGNSAKEKFQSMDFKLYKLEHPELLAWLNPDLSYETIQAITKQ